MKNVLLITSDQQHYMTLGINNKEIFTPNLDRLAKLGMSFDRAYCPNPTCTPTRASIITGLYPSEHKAWSLGTKLEENIPTIGELLKNNNIKTALIGKAHFQQLGSCDENGHFKSIESIPFMKDYDFWNRYSECFYGFEYIALLRNHTNEFLVGQHYGIWLNEKDNTGTWTDYYMKEEDYKKKNKYTENTIQPNGQMRQGMAWDIPIELHYNTFISEKTIQKIDEFSTSKDNFFIWASYPDPHPDYMVPEPYASMYKKENISLPESYYLEESLPSDLVKLTREKHPNYDKYRDSKFYLHGCHSHIQDEESLKSDLCLYYGMVTFLDDQVGLLLDHLEKLKILDETLILFTTDHGHYIGQHKLIRKGPFLYEDGIRVPFIAAGGGYKYPTKRCTELISLVDIYATIAKFFGVDYNELDVTSLALNDIFDSKESKGHEAVSCEFRHEMNKLHQRAIISKDHKLILTRGEDYGEIYNLLNDPLEQNNLWYDVILRNKLLEQMIWLETDKETLHMPRVSNA